MANVNIKMQYLNGVETLRCILMLDEEVELIGDWYVALTLSITSLVDSVGKNDVRADSVEPETVDVDGVLLVVKMASVRTADVTFVQNTDCNLTTVALKLLAMYLLRHWSWVYVNSYRYEDWWYINHARCRFFYLLNLIIGNPLHLYRRNSNINAFEFK